MCNVRRLFRLDLVADLVVVGWKSHVINTGCRTRITIKIDQSQWLMVKQFTYLLTYFTGEQPNELLKSTKSVKRI